MKNLYLALLFIISFIFNAFASELNAHTTLPLESEQLIQIAGIYWLPDYLKSNAARTDTDKGGGDTKKECETYGFITSCIPPKTPTGAVRPKQNLSCYKSCICPSSYNKTDTNCGTGYKAGPSKCDGFANLCISRPCSDGGYSDSTQTSKICSEITYGGRICYSCKPDPCYGLADKNPCPYGCQSTFAACTTKCQTCYADNCRNRTAVATPYGCQTYFTDCPSKCQSAYPDNCRNRTAKTCEYGCQSNYADCASKCETCKACSNTCDSDYTLQACSGNFPVEEARKTNQCGNICRKCRGRTCVEENARCPSGTMNLDYYYAGSALRCLMN